MGFEKYLAALDGHMEGAGEVGESEVLVSRCGTKLWGNM